MSKFWFLGKKRNTVVEEEKKEKGPTVFTITFDILGLCKRIKKRQDVESLLADLCMQYDLEEKDLGVCVMFITKLCIYNNICLAYNEEIISTATNLPPSVFLKFFLTFCFENKITFPSYLQFYKCGLMESKTKYRKYFEEILSENDFALFNLILKDFDISMKEAYFLEKKGILRLK